MKNKKQRSHAFTLIEILLVVAIIAILAGIVITAINPTKQLGDARNAQRRSDVNTILNAIYQYSIDNDGLPSAIQQTTTTNCNTGSSYHICKDSGNCTGATDLSVLTTSEKYLIGIPVDPAFKSNTNLTGYYVTKTTNGRVTVCAPSAEQGATIEASK